MIVNAEALARLYTALNAAFNGAFAKADTWFEKVAMTVPAATRIVDYKFLLDIPMMREWIDERKARDLKAEAFQVTTKDWEATIQIDRNDIADDQLGIFVPMVQMMADAAKRHPDKLVADLIKANPACYDGQDFFATTHPVGEGVASNLDAGASTAWYLLDVSRPIKPFLYQLRQGINLTRMDLPTNEEVFKRKKYQYGVDGRWTCAVALWQMAYKSTQDLTGDYYGNARAAMMSLTNADGEPLGVKPTLLVVPPALEGAARQLLNAQFVIGDGTAGGSKTNIWQGTAQLLVCPELA
jgi:phage major head subunit gpT-like protein